MGEQSKNPSATINGSKEEKTTATVSIRNMNLPIWYKAGYVAKTNKETISQYIQRLILRDLDENISE